MTVVLLQHRQSGNILKEWAKQYRSQCLHALGNTAFVCGDTKGDHTYYEQVMKRFHFPSFETWSYLPILNQNKTPFGQRVTEYCKVLRMGTQPGKWKVRIRCFITLKSAIKASNTQVQVGKKKQIKNPERQSTNSLLYYVLIPSQIYIYIYIYSLGLLVIKRSV